MNLNKQTELDELKTEIIKTEICSELANSATNLVFGSGNPNATVMFIGEAPGKNEDLQGLPFVGAAGKFLDEMLHGINFKREQVYITNIVKYRPPNNRDPLPEEKKAFLPILSRQIEIIKPLLVVTLGRHSMECLLPGQQISKIHGEPKRIKLIFEKDHQAKETKTEGDTIVVLPLFHPAAALYNGGMRQTLIDDFNLIPDILKKLKTIKNEKEQ